MTPTRLERLSKVSRGVPNVMTVKHITVSKDCNKESQA